MTEGLDIEQFRKDLQTRRTLLEMMENADASEVSAMEEEIAQLEQIVALLEQQAAEASEDDADVAPDEDAVEETGEDHHHPEDPQPTEEEVEGGEKEMTIRDLGLDEDEPPAAERQSAAVAGGGGLSWKMILVLMLAAALGVLSGLGGF